DIYVANDGEPNALWVGRGDGTFVEHGLALGVAVDGFGRGQGSMGLALGDVDGDGGEELLVTNFLDEPNALYRREGAVFREAASEAGLARLRGSLTGFGTALADLDLDGWLDALIANGG